MPLPGPARVAELNTGPTGAYNFRVYVNTTIPQNELLVVAVTQNRYRSSAVTDQMGNSYGAGTEAHAGGGSSADPGLVLHVTWCRTNAIMPQGAWINVYVPDNSTALNIMVYWLQGCYQGGAVNSSSAGWAPTSLATTDLTPNRQPCRVLGFTHVAGYRGSWSAPAPQTQLGEALAGNGAGYLNAGWHTRFTAAKFTLAATAPANTTHMSIAGIAAGLTPLEVTTTGLPNGTSGTWYSYQFEARGGSTDYVWYFDGLPPGMGGSGQGVLAGYPTTPGTYQITATAHTDTPGWPDYTASRSLELLIAPPPLVITTTLPGGQQGASYTATLTATGGIPPYTAWNVTGLPNGLSAVQAGDTYRITGTPAQYGSYQLTLQVTDSRGVTTTVAQTVSFQPPPLTIDWGTLPHGKVGESYNRQFTPAGGAGTYTWAATPGALPAGLTFSNGTLSGTPTQSGTFPVTLAVMAQTNLNGATTTLQSQQTLVIDPAVLTITSTLPNGTVGQPYNAPLTATGGITPYTWTATGLPPGLSASGAGIYGVPTAPGSYTVTLGVSDTSGASATASGMPLSIVAAPVTAVSVTTATLAPATALAAYTAGLAATGGTTPYTWTADGLPPGLAVADNVITGTLGDDPGIYPLTITVTDAGGQTAIAELDLAVQPAALEITSTLPPGAALDDYSAELTARGGVRPYTWIAQGLPAGLDLDPAAGVISGWPLTAGGTYPVTLTVTAGDSSATATQDLVLDGPPPLQITTADVPDGMVGREWGIPLNADGGVSPYTWAAGGLPAWAALDTAQQIIIGVPDEPADDITITLTVTDDVGLTATAELTFTIEPPEAPQITTVLPQAWFGREWQALLTADGGLPPYAWSVAGLPPGLETTGPETIAGRPDQPGRYQVTLAVSDTVGATTTETFRLDVGSAPISVIWDGLECSPGHLGEAEAFTAVVEDVTGWFDTPEADGNDIERVLADGSAWGPKLLAAREVTITGAAAGPRRQLIDLRDQLAARAAGRQPADLIITDPTLGPLAATVRSDSDTLRHTWLAGHRAFRWEVTVTAADPRLYEHDWHEEVLVTDPGTGSGRSYPRAYPWAYAAGAGANSAVLRNDGNAPAPVYLLYEGPLGQSRVTDGGDRAILLQALGNGVGIHVASETLVAEATGGLSRASYVRPGSQPLLIPPRSQVTWTLYGTEAGKVTLAWRSAWL